MCARMQQRRHQGDSCMACDMYDSSGCCCLCRRNDILHSTRSHSSNERFIAGGSATASGARSAATPIAKTSATRRDL